MTKNNASELIQFALQVQAGMIESGTLPLSNSELATFCMDLATAAGYYLARGKDYQFVNPDRIAERLGAELRKGPVWELLWIDGKTIIRRAPIPPIPWRH